MGMEWLKTSFEDWTFHHSAPLDASTQPILALHGFTGGGRDFRQLAEEEQLRGQLTWIAPDLPGHGDTGVLERERFSLEAMADTLHRFIVLHKIKPHLLGYSMGGRLALCLATTETPLSTLSVIGAHPGIEDASERHERADADKALAEHIRHIGVAAFADQWESHPLIKSQARIPAPFLEKLRANRRKQSAEGLALSLEESGTGAMSPLWAALAALKTPLFYAVGEEDVKFKELSRRLAKTHFGTNVAIIPQTGHCSHLESPSKFTTPFLEHITAL